MNTTALTPMREALASLRAATDVLRNYRLPEIRVTARAVEALGAAQVAPARPKESVLEEARRNLVAAAASDGFANVSRRVLREAPWLLWAEKEPLSPLPGLLDAVYALAARFGSHRRKLIQGWLLGYAATQPRIEEGGHAIRQLLATSNDARLDAWRHADRTFDLFDARYGPRRVATTILRSDQPVAAILREAGLSQPLQAIGGYARAVHAEVLSQIGTGLAKPGADEALARCAEFLAPDGRLRFEDGPARGEIANGLLTPWLRGSTQPSDSVRSATQSFLLQHLGDPRTRPQYWRFAGDETIALMRRWLAKASLKAFFSLIADHALDEHWTYREAFWSECLNKGVIEDAWLALGTRVFASARAVKDLNGAYARLEGERVAGNQSVLLLRIGGNVFCEWSHNGKLRVWPSDWKNAPRMGALSYGRDDLTGKGLPFPPNARFGSRGAPDGNGLSHIGSERSYWQGSAAELLARRTGLHLTPADWMPR